MDGFHWKVKWSELNTAPNYRKSFAKQLWVCLLVVEKSPKMPYPVWFGCNITPDWASLTAAAVLYWHRRSNFHYRNDSPPAANWQSAIFPRKSAPISSHSWDLHIPGTKQSCIFSRSILTVRSKAFKYFAYPLQETPCCRSHLSFPSDIWRMCCRQARHHFPTRVFKL